MATIKSYSDLEQSKKLAEILPLESSDMGYNGIEDRDIRKIRYSNVATTMPNMDSIPCWSLAALLSVLDFPSLTQRNENEWEVCTFDHDNDGYIEKIASNPVDACYEMILKLHELNLL